MCKNSCDLTSKVLSCCTCTSASNAPTKDDKLHSMICYFLSHAHLEIHTL